MPGLVSSKNNPKHRRLFTSRVLLVLFLAISLYQYVTAGQVTWITQSFRWIENSAKSVWVDPKAYLSDSAVAVSDYAGGVVDSVAKQATDGKPVSKPSIAIPRGEIAWSAPAYDLSGRVVKVTDGDTITILDAAKKQHEIRLHGIDSPDYPQPYASAAKKVLASLVAGEGVGIDVKDTDRYGRTVGVVHKNNLNVNLQMVKSGNAWWYKKYAPFNDDLESAQKHARADKLGLWAEPDPMPPWEWRRRNR